MSKSTDPRSKLLETVVDGRLTNVFYRREQLSRVHAALLQNKNVVLDAIVKDSGCTRAEAFTELYLTLSAIKLYHDELKPEAELKAEYGIAKGEDVPDAREGVGSVSIAPQAHSFVYSLVVPLCAAIAAGNCVVVVLEQTLRELPSVLSRVLEECLDPAIIEMTKNESLDLGANYIKVIQTGGADPTSSNVLFSPSDAVVVAVVDRTADVDAAARTVLDARMAFNGSSPYAPDIVLVNEFAKKDFLRAVVTHSVQYMTAENGPVANKAKRTGDSGSNPDWQKSARTITSGSNGSIVEVEDRTALSRISKVKSRTLSVHGVRSLDDAIEVANDISKGRALAAYAFADLKSCKYLLQFISADVGLANVLPMELLVGPAAPRGHPVTLSARYSPSLFSSPRPKYAQKTAVSTEVEQIMSNQKLEAQSEEKLLKQIGLGELRRPVKHITGYFEGAFFVGAGVIMTPVLVGASTLAYYGIQKAIVRWK